MEMVASVKMQKAVRAIETERAYIQHNWKLVVEISDSLKDFTHPYLEVREVKNVAMLVVSSDRGLCGAFNTDIVRKFKNYVTENPDQISFDHLDIIAFGSKAADSIAKMGKGNLVASFDTVESEVNFDETSAVSKILLEGYLSKKYDKIILLYPHFVSSLTQKPVINQLLPISRDNLDVPELWKIEYKEEQFDYKFEPSLSNIISEMLPIILKTQVYGAVLEANASEQSSRMVAMKNATDNAGDLIDELQLTYNSIRQDSITREIAEISAGAEALG